VCPQLGQQRRPAGSEARVQLRVQRRHQAPAEGAAQREAARQVQRAAQLLAEVDGGAAGRVCCCCCCCRCRGSSSAIWRGARPRCCRLKPPRGGQQGPAAQLLQGLLLVTCACALPGCSNRAGGCVSA
jgi:hypothetical protein